MLFHALTGGIAHLDGHSPKMDLSSSVFFTSLLPLMLFTFPVVLTLLSVAQGSHLHPSLSDGLTITSSSGFSIQILFSFYMINAFTLRTSQPPFNYVNSCFSSLLLIQFPFPFLSLSPLGLCPTPGYHCETFAKKPQRQVIEDCRTAI